MFEKILTPGEKIKEIRTKKLHVTQSSLSGGRITRNLISLVEKEKAKLSNDTAQIIAENINKIAKEKNIVMNKISADYLLETEDHQANNLIGILINKLNLIKAQKKYNEEFFELINKIENIISRYSIRNDLKYSAYILISEIYYDNYRFIDSSTYIWKCIEITNFNNNYEGKIKALLLVISIKYRLKRFDDILSLTRLGIDIIKSNNLEKDLDNLLKKLYFNRALAYKKVGHMQKAINYLQILKNLNLKCNEELDIKLLEANCYLENNNLIEAESLYLNLYRNCSNIQDPSQLLILIASIAEFYYKISDLEQAKYYSDISLDIKNILNMSYKLEALYWNFKINISLDNTDVKKSYYKTIILAEKINNYDIIYKTVDSYLDYIINKNDTKEIYLLMDKLEIKIKDKKYINKEFNVLFSKVAKHFFYSDNEYSFKLINKSILYANIN